MNAIQRARGLGWFSIGLGLTQVVAPIWLGRLLSIGDRRILLRALGIRELLTGLGILIQPRPTMWLWARVAGDLMDVALLAAARTADPIQRSRVAGAAGVVVAIGMLDLVCAQQLSKR